MAEHSDAPTTNPLSEREMEVAQLLVTGASNAEIARDLVISPHTVKVHLRNIFEKLQAASRTEATMLLLQHGWIVVSGVDVQPGESLPPPPPPPPEPAALTDQPVTVQPWQIVYMLAALVLSLTVVVLPNLVGLAQASASLLTDAGRSRTSPAAIRNEPRWEVRTPLDQPLSRLGMVALDNGLYVVGGESAQGAAVADVAVYDLGTNTWRAVASLPRPLANVAATAFDGRIYVAGGSTRETVPGAAPGVAGTLLAYDPGRDRWQEVGDLPQPVAGAALAATEDALYLVGGWDGREMRDEIWRYQPGAGGTEGSWELAGHMSKGRAFLGAVAVGGEIYLVGGYDGQRDLDLAEVFTPVSGERRQLPPLGNARGGLALVYDGVAIYALGGGYTRPITTHERFDPATSVWTNFPSPVQGEWRNLAGAAGSDGVYMAGGWGGDYLDQLLQYQSSFRTLLPVIITD